VSYLVLARKYRPQTFEDLVGQGHVAKTLANAIAQGRIAHAFLFTGVRGVGKTTSARLLAKCLNCLGDPDAPAPAAGPTATPCNKCAACKEIAAGTDIDVQEIDGASYNGVDEVRRLQEGLSFRPARDRFKIYIVDEVHMLSNQAWNAFLKTLEEPPPHVKFIFATTEVHKVPVTILSRCQRYDFKLIATQTIAARLREVLGRENVVAEDGAISVLAREAAGSMRDAMSLVDQVIAFSGDNLTADDVTRVLGVADRTILHELATALVTGDAPAALKVVDRLTQQGFDLGHVARDVLRHLRNLVVAKICGEGGRELLDLADEEVADILALASSAEQDDLLRLYQGFSRGFDEIARSGQPRTALEMTLVRLARRPPLLPLDELLARLGDLEKRLQAPPPPSPGGAPPSAGRGGGGSGVGRSVGAATGSASASSSAFFAPPAWVDAPMSSSPLAERTRGSLALADAPAPFVELHPPPRPPAPPAPLLPPPAARLPAPVAPPPPLAPADLEAWRTILDRVRTARPVLASILEHASPVEVSAERVLLGYSPGDFLGQQAAEEDAALLLQREVRAHFGAATKVELDLSMRAPVRASVASIDEAKRQEQIAAARAAVENHPLVREAIALFGAEIRDVRLPGGD
jgi:DNA polymerase III subunit gamma/tau